MNPDFWNQFSGLLVLVGASEVSLTNRGVRELVPRFAQAGLSLQGRVPLKEFLAKHQALLRHERAQEVRNAQFRGPGGQPSLENVLFLRKHLPAEDKALLSPVLALTPGRPAPAQSPPAPVSPAAKPARPTLRLVKGGAASPR